MRRIAILAAGTTIALVVTACGSSSSQGSGSASPGSANTGGKTLTSVKIATEQSFTTLDGIMNNTIEIDRAIYSFLTKLDVKGAVVPDTASRWTSDTASTTWTFTLRAGVTFTDGSPLNATDVAFTYNTIMKDPKSLQLGYTTNIKTVTAMPDGTVQFVLKSPDVTWPRQVSLIPILPSDAYTKLGAAAFVSHPIGSGPYKVVSFETGSTVVLAANTTYFGGTPKTAKVTMENVPNATTRLTGLQSGDFDLATVDSNSISTLQGAGLTVKSVPSAKVSYLGYNTTVPGLDNAKLREAITYAIDRAGIVKTLLNGKGTPTAQLVAPSVTGYAPDVAVPKLDVAKAKQMVKDSGYAGQPIDFQYATGGFVPAVADVAQTISSELNAIGIKVQLDTSSQSTFLSDWFSKKLKGMYLFSFQNTTLDATQTYQYLVNITATFSDPTLNGLLSAQLGQSDPSARKKSFNQIATIINELGYYTPLFTDTVNYAHSKKIAFDYPADGYMLPQLVSGAS